MLVLGVLVLLLPGMFRETPFMIGDEGFYHLRISSELLENGRIDYDELSFSGRSEFLEKGLSYSIAGVAFITKSSVESSAKLLFLLLGVVSLVLIHLILKSYSGDESMLAMPILIFSPAFVYLFSVVNKFTIPVFLTLLLIWLLLKKKYIISAVVFLITPFFNYEYFLFLIFIAIFVLLYIKSKKYLLIIYSFIFVILLFGLRGINLNIISDFGSNIGLSIFGIFIVLFGFGFSWKKKKLIHLYIIGFLLFLVSLKFSWVIFLLNIPFSLLIAFNLNNLVSAKWESGLIKELTVLLLICGLLFSGISSVKSLSEEEPNEGLFTALGMLPRGSVVLSHHSNGHWISYSGMKNVIDGFVNFENIEERDRDVNELFRTRDFNIATNILNKYNVDYILVDNKMKHGLVWSEEEEGLLFLLKYSEDFEKIYENDIEIWRYLG